MQFAWKMVLIVGGLALATTAAGAAYAQQAPAETPKGFNWTTDKSGNRVAKPGSRITNPDGSWREETRKGECVSVKERTANGEIKTTNSCG